MKLQASEQKQDGSIKTLFGWIFLYAAKMKIEKIASVVNYQVKIYFKPDQLLYF